MQRYYRIEDPLALSWRRFNALLTNLPGDSAFMTRLRVARGGPEPKQSILDFIDAQQGRPPVSATRSASLDELREGN